MYSGDMIMKRLLLISALILSACGSDPSSGGAGGGSGGGSPNGSPDPVSGLNTYEVRLSGDGVTFTLSLFTDLGEATEEQLVLAPTTIGAGQTLVYTVEGNVFENASGFSYLNGVNVLTAQVFKNGNMVENATLTTAGTNHAFSEH